MLVEMLLYLASAVLATVFLVLYEYSQNSFKKPVAFVPHRVIIFISSTSHGYNSPWLGMRVFFVTIQY